MNPPLRFRTHSKAFYDYWKYEDGCELLQKLPSTPDISKAISQMPLLFEKDDLADRVIEDVFTGKPFPQAMQLVTDYALGKLPMQEAPDSIRQLLSQMESMPGWVTPGLLEAGRKVCQLSGKSGLLVLRNYSLMIGYQSAAINKPLIVTGALHKGAVKRIAETTDFWCGVTAAQALQFKATGFVYCLKTRLIHAYSRVMIKQKSDWQLPEQGEPLNHWDMQAVYLGFSLVYIQGLRRLGFSITDPEAEAVYHLWKYIGYLIGIPAHLMPDNDSEAIERLYLWSITQPEADADSIALAQALHHEPIHAVFPKRLWEKKLIQHVNLAFNHHLIGRRSCEVLQLPKSPFRYFIIKTVTVINFLDNAIIKVFPAYRSRLVAKGRREQLKIRDHMMENI